MQVGVLQLIFSQRTSYRVEGVGCHTLALEAIDIFPVGSPKPGSLGRIEVAPNYKGPTTHSQTETCCYLENCHISLRLLQKAYRNNILRGATPLLYQIQLQVTFSNLDWHRG